MLGWFRKRQAGPDFSTLDSREKVQAAVADGRLVPMLLMPEEFGGPAEGMNVVFVPVWAAALSCPSLNRATLPSTLQSHDIRAAASFHLP
jgi:hypothetical protein